MKISRIPSFGAILLAAGMAAHGVGEVRTQVLRDSDRARGRTMLRVVMKEIQKYYYDPTFHGLDLDAVFLRAGQEIDLAASLSQVFVIIARAVLELGDSHTRFVPPPRTVEYQYGWQMRMIDTTPYIVAVKPGTDAAAKGLKAGDAVLTIDGVAPTRQNLPLLRYRYYSIRPVPGQRLTVKSPGGRPRSVDVLAMVNRRKRVRDFVQGEDYWDSERRAEHRSTKTHAVAFKTNRGPVVIWNLPTFLAAGNELERFFGRFRGAAALVLDLRGNAGGYFEAAARLLGVFFDHNVLVARPRGRRGEMEPIVAKPRGKTPFAGKLIVIVDSDTSSSAELFARVIQLENRGTVIGDQTAGTLMQARYHPERLGGTSAISYGISIAEANLILADGRSLEKRGVTPDIAAMPTGEDLAAGRDPVLARAARLVGLSMTAEAAGRYFPYKWTD